MHGYLLILDINLEVSLKNYMNFSELDLNF